ncbi:MAG: hypothetical protein ACREP8_09020, partial [Candidatus Binatia bacterium]
MNVLFLTQSLSLSVFYDVAKIFEARGSLSRAGFYVSDPAYFERFSAAFPEIDSGRALLLKEWEIVRDSAGRPPDLAKIAAYEKRLDVDSLWSPVIGDRRIYNGPQATLRQDYRARYSHERILSILDLGLERMDALFERLKPDWVVSFVCVTLGEYLAYLFAKSQAIPFLNLRPTRIQNYMYAGESVLEPSEFLTRAYQTALKSPPEKQWVGQAKDHLQKVRETHARYEGVIRVSARPPRRASKKRTAVELIVRLPAIVKEEGRALWGVSGSRSGDPTPLQTLWFAKVRRPLRAWHVNRSLQARYVRESELPRLCYAFFPLHAEPEVSLNVYNKSYLNQIEAVRLVSHHLPVGMKLLV